MDATRAGGVRHYLEGVLMSPRTARICAGFQLSIAVGFLPLALLVVLTDIPSWWWMSVVAISALGIPYTGFLASICGPKAANTPTTASPPSDG